MGSNESQNCIYYDMYSSLATVALSAQPPGVNELCVCVSIDTVWAPRRHGLYPNMHVLVE